MSVLSYPEFVEGQTLTREELNELRDHLVGRDSTLGRTVGFGIAGGLVGTVQGGTLHIAPGLAIDQTGEALLLPSEELIPVPPTPDSDAFGFVTGTDGFTVVLVRTDVTGKRTPCTETGCQGHALPHTTGVDLRIVQGRLTSSLPDFGKEDLLSVTPLALTKNGAVTGAFVGLRDAITKRIGARLQPALLAKLSAMTLDTTDLPAVKAYKAGFLNQVLFATLDLLRFEALVSQETLRDTRTPGVALGWLHQVGAAWVWDCGYRHHWEPPAGLTLALLGGSCAQPGLPWLQRLESLIDTFTLPPVPKPDDPPVHFDRGQVFICKRWARFQHQDCNVILYPAKTLPTTWPEHWTKQKEGFTFPPEVYKPTLSHVIYEIDSPDPVEAGVIDLGYTFGRLSNEVKDGLTTLIQDAGLTASIQVMTLSDAVDSVKTPGFSHSGVVGVADQMVLIEDAAHKVVGTGRVALGRSQRELGTALPAARAKADNAAEIATGLTHDVTELSGTVADHGRSLEGFTKFQDTSTRWRSGVDQRLSGLTAEVATQTQTQIVNFQKDFSAQLPGLVSASIGGLGQKLSATAEQVERLGGRVDILSRSPRVGLTERDLAVNAGLLEVLRTVRTSIEEVAPDDRREAMRASLAAADDGLVRLAAATEAGGSALSDSPQTLTAVVDSLVEGLRAVGAPAATVRILRTQTRALRSALEQ
jgi:hypothetical protein